MLQGSVVTVAAWFEIGVGGIFLTAPAVPCRLLFAATPEGVGIPLGRFAGVALVAFGVACLSSAAGGARRSAALGLVVFNAGATIFLVWVVVATTFRGFLLWPAVILHAVIAAALLPQFLSTVSTTRPAGSS